MTDDTEDRLTALENELREIRSGAEPRAAPLGWFQVAPGQSILSDHMNTAIAQGVVPFASAAARAAAVPAPAEGMMTTLADNDQLERWSGSAWVPVIRSTRTPGVALDTPNLKLRFGTETKTTDSGGWVSVTFPEPFPNACLGVVANNTRHDVGVWVIPYSASFTPTGFSLLAVAHEGTYPSGLVLPFTYIAWGY